MRIWLALLLALGAAAPALAVDDDTWFAVYGNKCEACRVLVEESLNGLTAEVHRQLRESASNRHKTMNVDSSRVVDELCDGAAYDVLPSHFRRACRLMLRTPGVADEVAVSLEGNYKNEHMQRHAPELVDTVCRGSERGWCPAAPDARRADDCALCEFAAGQLEQLAARLPANAELDAASSAVDRLCAEVDARFGYHRRRQAVCEALVEEGDDALLREVRGPTAGRGGRLREVCGVVGLCGQRGEL